MSGNSEKQTLKIFIWRVNDWQEGCRCQLIAVGYSASEGEKKALETIDKEINCGWCIEPHVYHDGEDGDIDAVATWNNYIRTVPPSIFEVERGAVLSG